MCGIVGIISQHPVATELYDSLIHLQHRGQDAAGIMTCEQRFFMKHGLGLVREVFHSDDMAQLPGAMGLGHVRYPTAGAAAMADVQPFWMAHPFGIAFAHNGNLTNHFELRQALMAQHRHLNSSTDSEVMLHLLAEGLTESHHADDDVAFFDTLCRAVTGVMDRAKGGYAVVSAIIGKGMIAFRDPHGIRPLVMGVRDKGGQQDHIFASEPTMFYSLDFAQTSDVAPGELVYVSTSGQLFRRTLTTAQLNPCIFEYVYFARPDAKLDDVSVYRARLRMGQNLATEWQQTYPDLLPDIVIPAPFTANTAALSFAHEIGVRYSEGLYKNPFIGRTFIMPSHQERKRSVRYKLSPQQTEINNKKVLVVDDSIVRGTTSREIVRMVREFGAKEVYFVSAAPPIAYPCFYGVDIPSKKELIASEHSVAAIADYMGVDKLLYLSQEGVSEAVMRKGGGAIARPCMACMNGCYVANDIDEEKMQQLERQRGQPQ